DVYKRQNEIVFTRNTTESINLIAYAWARKNLKKGDTILTTEMEHHSNIVPWQQAAKEVGLELEFIKVKDYKLDLSDLDRKLMANGQSLLAVTHISNTLGTINPIKQIIKKVHKKGSLVLIDGAQAVPHMKVDVQDLDSDFYAFSGHKMLGPMGIGVLHVKEEILKDMDPFLTGGGMIQTVKYDHTDFAELPDRTDAGTPNVAGAIGLAAAIDYLEKIGMDKVEKHEKELTKYALKKLKEIDEVSIIGIPTTKDRLGVVSFEIKGVHSHDTAQVLNEEGVAVRAGHHCNQVLMREVLKVPATARASFYVYNEKEDIDKLVSAIKKVIKTFKS
ncbi:MAG TPA: aminotransferase class V-fold PLP-dependent enzyme, partial [bacterium]|nr:aminotransferase class V-fold PLP-dependent enzyme [bacterium]